MIKTSTHYSNTHFILLAGMFIACLAASIFSLVYWIIILPFVLVFFYFGWQQWQFIFFLLILTLPWSIEYNFNQTLGTDLPDEPLMLFTAALCAAQLFYKPRDISSVWKHPLISLLLLHLGWIIVTILFSTDPLISLKFFLAKAWYLAAFVFTPLFIFTGKKPIRITAIVLTVSMMLLVIIVLYRHSAYGYTFARINDALSPFFRNHVNYSAMLVCMAPLLAAMFHLHKKSRLIILALSIIFLAALFLSYARGAWLALVVGIIAYWLITKKKLLITYVIGMIICITALFWIKANDRYLGYAHDFRTTIFHKNFSEHLVATYRLKDVSTAERFNRWIAGVRMVKDKWATGYGPNTFYYNYKPYTIPAFKTWVSVNKDRSTVHNYFLLTIIEQGIPGLLFFLLLTGAMLYYAEHLYRRIRDQFYKTAAMVCGVMISMIIVVNFLSDLIETDKVGSLFFLCLGTLVAIDRLNPPSHIQRVSQSVA